MEISEKGLTDSTNEIYQLADELDSLTESDDLIEKSRILGAKLTGGSIAASFGGVFSVEQMREMLPQLARDVETNARALGEKHPAMVILRRMLVIYRQMAETETSIGVSTENDLTTESNSNDAIQKEGATGNVEKEIKNIVSRSVKGTAKKKWWKFWGLL